MESTRTNTGYGWLSFASIVLIIGGAFGIIDGLMAVNRARFFTANAVYVFSDLNTWGWIVFGLGIAAVAAGFAVTLRRQWARWTGIGVAGLSAIGNMMFMQAYPIWSLLIIGLDIAVIYGLAVYGGREIASAAGQSGVYEVGTSSSEAGRQAAEETRRAA
jgi:hypothetical protein